jgi:nitrile hydratase
MTAHDDHDHDHHHGHDHGHHHGHDHGEASDLSETELRVRALQTILVEKGYADPAALDAIVETYETKIGPHIGARIVARAWTDPAFRERLFANGREAVTELGLSMPPHHRHLVVLENTSNVHNVICCTLCSCTAFSIIGLPPDWYKDLEYRARVVRQSRTVLKEMGLDLPADMEIRVWDTTADTRYMVLPVRPDGTEGWSEEKLAGLVTKDAMIGVSRL